MQFTEPIAKFWELSGLAAHALGGLPARLPDVRPRPPACGDTAEVCCLSRPLAAASLYKVIAGCIHPSSSLLVASIGGVPRSTRPGPASLLQSGV